MISKYIKDQLEWPEIPPLVAGPPTLNDLKAAWPVSRKVPVAEIFKSLGLTLPEHAPLALGAAAEDSFLVPAGDDEASSLATFECEDTGIPPVPLSSDDEPLLATA